MKSRLRYGWLAAMSLFAAAANANAGLLPTSATSTANNDGTVRYTYGIVLTSNSTLKAGDYFTVYDFQGMQPGSNVQPTGWSLSVSNTGMTPAGTVPTDNASLPNLTWTYTGPQTLTGQQGIGNFSVVSSNQPSNLTTEFTSLTQRSFDGQADSNITETLMPSAGSTPPPGVPEPATLALVGIGLPFAAAFYRRRRA